MSLIGVLLFLRYNNATYSLKWEEYLESYGALGLTPRASLSEVKRMYHRLSLTRHPDKLGDKCDAACKAEWVRVSDTYSTIKDYHSGRLKIVNKPTRFDKGFATRAEDD